MTHIPSAAPPREVTGGAPATQTTAEAPDGFALTLLASLHATLGTDTRSKNHDGAHDVRHAAQRSADAQHAGVTRPATVAELAGAELATSTYEPVTPEPAQTNVQVRSDARRERPSSPPPAARQTHHAPAQPSPKAATPQDSGGSSGRVHASEAPPTPASTKEGVTPAVNQAQPRQPAAAGTAVVPSAASAVARAAAAVPARTVQAMPGVAAATRPGATAAKAKAAPAPPSPHVLRHAKAFQLQLQKGLAAALNREGTSITLNLRPRNLGRLTIELSVRGHDVDARIRTTTESARSLLESASVDLRDSLSSRGLTLQRLDVEIRDQNDQSPVHDESPDTSNDHAPGREHEQPESRAGVDEPVPPEEPDEVVMLGLDITV